jgi:hypothetical protein
MSLRCFELTAEFRRHQYVFLGFLVGATEVDVGLPALFQPFSSFLPSF